MYGTRQTEHGVGVDARCSYPFYPILITVDYRDVDVIRDGLSDFLFPAKATTANLYI